MKYFKFLSIIIILLLSNIVIKAQTPDCPPGWSQISFSLQVGQGSTCRYKVWVCYKCTAYGVHYNIDSMEFVRVEPVNKLCTKPYGDVILAAEKKILDPYFIDSTLCDIGDVPPCNDPYEFLVTVKSHMCWKKYNDPDYFDPEFGDPDDPGILYYEKYSNYPAECFRVWKFCWDEVLQDYKICVVEMGILNGPANCLENEPKDPDEYQWSSCFQVMNPCTNPNNYEKCLR